MKQKYLREHIPLFESEDNEELVESLIVLGINSFLESSGAIGKQSTKALRASVEQICLDFEKFKMSDNGFKDVKSEIEKISKKVSHSALPDNKSEISSIKANQQSCLSYYSRGAKSSQAAGIPPTPTKMPDFSHGGHDGVPTPSKVYSSQSHRHLSGAVGESQGFERPTQTDSGVSSAGLKSNRNGETGRKKVKNDESDHGIWKQPGYLVDQRDGPTAKITQMRAPDVVEYSPLIVQRNRKADSQQTETASVRDSHKNQREPHFQRSESIGNMKPRPKQEVIDIPSSHNVSRVARTSNKEVPLPSHPPKFQRPSSAGPAIRDTNQSNFKEGSSKLSQQRKKVKENKANLPIAPSSESSEKRRQIQAEKPISSSAVLHPTREERHSNRSSRKQSSGLNSETQSIVMTEDAKERKATNANVVMKKKTKQEVIMISAHKEKENEKKASNEKKDASRGRRDSKERSVGKGGQEEIKKFKQVESKIKGLIQQDKKKHKQEGGKEAVDYLTEEECTFRKEEEQKEKSKGNSSLEISHDEGRSSMSSTGKLLTAGGAHQKPRKSSAKQEYEDKEEVIDIASKLLNSSILKRFNNNPYESSSKKLVAAPNHPNHSNHHNPHHQKDVFDSNPWNKKHAAINDQDDDYEDDDRKEDFNAHEYQFDHFNSSHHANHQAHHANDTSRASSQFSAFHPNEDMKEFFKQEFAGNGGNGVNGTTATNNVIGEESYLSSKLTYGGSSSQKNK